MNMINYFTKVLKNYANFKGRARRSEFWYFNLMVLLISIPLEVLKYTTPSLGIISSIWSLAMLIPSISVGVRRMHDVGKSGWFLIIPIYSLILACTEGTKGPNEYGEDPKGEAGNWDFDKPTETTL